MGDHRQRVTFALLRSCLHAFADPPIMDINTLAVHAACIEDLTAGSVSNPIYLSTTFDRSPVGEIGPKGFMYTRANNPNRAALEKIYALMEGGTEAFAFSSGMAATLAVFQTILQPGAHVVISDDCYHGVLHLLSTQFPRWEVSFTSVDMTDATAVERALRPETRLILVETPSNPKLKITDLAAVAEIGRRRGVATACDNTWATPLITRPLSLGIDLVLHSSTKYFGGHSDVLGGCVVMRESGEWSSRLKDFQNVGGAVPSPFDCWLLVRSIATMPLRVRQQSESAAVLAAQLAVHPAIDRVYYPGLPTHTNHEVAVRQMQGHFGGMLSIEVKGGQHEALAFASKLRLFRHATSLGGVESLVEHRLTAEGAFPKSPPNLIRVSVGIESVGDLSADLHAALG